MLVNSDKIDEQVGILHSEQLEYYTKNIEGSDEDIYEYVKRGNNFRHAEYFNIRSAF